MLLPVLLLATLPVAIAANPDRADAAVKLDAVRERIQELEQSIEAARGESTTLQQQLRTIEADIRSSQQHLDELRADIDEHNQRLQQLDERQREYEAELGEARAALARQMRAAYRSGRRDYLKLLLKQQDPELMGRMLTYYDYFNRARSRQIANVSQELEQLAAVAREIENERAAKADLEALETARLTELQGLEHARNQVIAHLKSQIKDQSGQLTGLREDQQRLQKLLEDLRRREAAPTPQPDRYTSFSKLEGKLDWPLDGRILNSFGSSRRGGALTWQGVRIDAERGEPVHAISAGEVVFADWFRTLGLLIIIDHGNGYMSLYGHNQDLLKQRGDRVEGSEVVAHAGESGGQERTALYFEIRHDGKPVNPARWCRR